MYNYIYNIIVIIVVIVILSLIIINYYYIINYYLSLSLLLLLIILLIMMNYSKNNQCPIKIIKIPGFLSANIAYSFQLRSPHWVPPLGLRRRVVPVGQATVPSLANSQRTAEPAVAWEGLISGGKVEINHLLIIIYYNQWIMIMIEV